MAITSRALAALIKGKKDTDRVYVGVKDSTGHPYRGHVADLLNNSQEPDRSHCTIIADDGEVVWKVPVRRIQWVDVRPRPDGH